MIFLPAMRGQRWRQPVIGRRSKEKGRLVSQTAFPVLRQPHIDGRFQNLCTGGLSPGRVLLGSRCISGQSRSGARSDAMVSHLRKMSPLSRDYATSTRTRRHLSPLFPLFTAGDVVIPGRATWRGPGIHTPVRGYGFRARSLCSRPGMTASPSVSRRPGLVVAGGLGPSAARQGRAGGPIGLRRAGHVRHMRLFPLTRGVALLGRRHVDGVMHPAVP
jgi:hypothetical protein